MFCKGRAAAVRGSPRTLVFALFCNSFFYFLLTIALDGGGLGLHFVSSIGAWGLQLCWHSLVRALFGLD